ncbi:MAG: hypothetical protein Q4G03_03500 [Planctomycetia bacterium]|nr:hypothetical protein [Planctomycetia bacterium]
MKFFIAGIMQGSKQESSIHSQSYRAEITRALQQAFPDAEVYDPFAQHNNSLGYTHEEGKRVFLTHNRMCSTDVDVLIAFLPEASMGGAIEIWEAWQNGAVVVTISPMTVNWVVKFLSDVVYSTPEKFYNALNDGSLAKFLANQNSRAIKRSLDNLSEQSQPVFF